MKFASLSVAVLLLAFASWAQDNPQNPPAANQPAAPAQTPSPGAPMHHHGMSEMGPEHMQQMKAHVEKMRATVDQMKSNLSKIKDPAARQQAQLDADLWDGMVKHMQAMVDMMSDHQPGTMGGMGAMDHDGMAMMHDDCCAGMQSDLKAGGCCSGGKCMKPQAPPAPPGPGASGPSSK